MNTLIPPLDNTFGIPSPTWVFILLMNLTLVLHFLLMGYAFTTALLGIFWSAAPEGSAAKWMLRRTERFLPVALSFAITLGVAPLLFVQVLYPSFFYASNIMIGYQWMGIIFVLIGGFYLIYLLQGGVVFGRRIPRACEFFGRVTIFLCLFYVMLTQTTNALLMLHPEMWAGVKAAGGTSLSLGGTTLKLTQLPVFWPRLAHNFVAALVIGSVWMMAFGAYAARRTGAGREETAGGQSLAKLGGLLTVGAVLVEFVTGLWLFIAESPEVQKMLIASFRPAALLWLLALLAGLGLLVLGVLGLTQPRLGWVHNVTGGVLLVLLAGMFAGREAVRQVRLAPYFKMDQWEVHLGNGQLSSLVLFLVVFVLTLGLVGLMLGWLWQSQGTPGAVDSKTVETPPNKTAVS